MESTSEETKEPSQPNQGTLLQSAFMDSIALQEQFFERSLPSQQLWSQQLADAQEARIKAAVQKTTECAAEVDEIVKGENNFASEVKTHEFNSERGNKEWKAQLQPPSQQFSRSKSRSTFFQHPEVYKKHRKYSPGDHVSKWDVRNFNSYTRYDHYKDHYRSHHRENACDSEDRRLHTGRSLRRCWNRERRSPSKSEPRRYCQPWRYCREESHSSRSGSFGCQSIDSRSRNYHRVCRSPVDDSRKHGERRGASSLETGRSQKSRDFLLDDHNVDHVNYINEVSEPTGTRQSKQTVHGNSLNAKAPLASVCVSDLQDHLQPLPLGNMAHSTKTGCWPSVKVGNGPERMRKSQHDLYKGTNACTKFRKTHKTDLKDMIVKKKELDETSLVNKARDAKELLNDPTEITRYPSSEWGSKRQLEPEGRKELGRKHYIRNEGEGSEYDSGCVDAKLEARKKRRK